MHDFVKLWLAGSFLLLSLVLLFRKKRLYCVGTLLSIILLLVGIISRQIGYRDAIFLTVLDTRDSISILVTKNDHAALIGCGGFSTQPILSELKVRGISSLDYFHVLGQGEEEYQNALEIIKTVKVENLIVPENGLQNDIFKESVFLSENIFQYDEKVKVQLWDESFLIQEEELFVKLNIYGKSLLICLPNSNMDTIPNTWENSKITIMNYLPENWERLQSKLVIFPADEQLRKENSLMQSGIADYICVVDGENLYLEFSPGKEIGLRSEL